MKTLLVIGLLLGTGWAGEKLPVLKLNDGTEFTEVEVKSKSAIDIRVSHKHGVTSIKLKEIPPDVLKRLSLDTTRSGTTSNVPALQGCSRRGCDEMIGEGKDTQSGRYREYSGGWGAVAIFPYDTFAGIMFQLPPDDWHVKNIAQIAEIAGFKNPEWKVLAQQDGAETGISLSRLLLENSKGDRWIVRGTRSRGKWAVVNFDSPGYAGGQSK